MPDPEAVAGWIAARRRGDTFRIIAARGGVDESTVRRACEAREVPRRRTGPPRRDAITVTQVVGLREAGLSQRQIAGELRCSGQLVRSRLAEAGLAPPADLRPRKGKPRASPRRVGGAIAE